MIDRKNGEQAQKYNAAAGIMIQSLLFFTHLAPFAQQMTAGAIREFPS
ncbi:hypothetical protein [Sinanaerobacter chloroacetimidivorans]|nr:hypothetical protein [Sinanaerobacter chloroacetimidivorans]